MSKKGLFKRGIALLLSVIMAFALAIPVSAAQTPDAEDGTAITDRIVGADRKIEGGATTDEIANPDEEVRVSIVLEKPSTIEKGFSTIGIAQNASAMSYRDQLYQEQEALQTKIEAEALEGEKLDVVWNLTLAANLISANVKRGEIEAIEKVAGVKGVFVERKYSPDVVSIGGGVADPQMAISSQMTGATGAWDTGYTGAGAKIAIIDTGIDAEHQSFNEGAFNYSISTQGFDLSGLMDAGDIADVFARLNISEDRGASASALFRNNKIAYGWNYVDHNSNISHMQDTEGEHGSHVAGIAAANKYIPDGNGGYKKALDAVGVQGVAPDAQLLIMKVFGVGGGAHDADCVAAIEDAILLGADSVNLSLGMAIPGMASPFEGDPYAEIQETLVNSDTVVVYSAGNAGAWADDSAPGDLYSDGISFSMGGESGSYTNSFTVASVDNKGIVSPSIEVGGSKYYYTDTSNQYIPSGLSFGETLDPKKEGTEYPFIMLDAGTAGSEKEALKALKDRGFDFSGKIVIVHRGTTNFSVKANAIDAVGAAAGIVANNTPNERIGLVLSDYTGKVPVASILQVEGQEIFASGTPISFTYSKGSSNATGSYVTGKMTVISTSVDMDLSVGNTMSDYSSWGTTGDLALKPEITAPGGGIYSVWGANASESTGQTAHNAYELMSGTSMAAPQVTGVSALVQQAIEKKSYDEGMTDRALTMALLMSTATPLSDADGMIFSMLQQGAGLVNAQAALSTPAYITVDGREDGKAKVELGDDPDKTGEYKFSFTVHNLIGEDLDYAFDGKVLTQLSDGENLFKSTTPISGAEVKFYVNGVELSSGEDKYDSKYDYNNDRKITKEDAQILLDAIMMNNFSKLGADKETDLNGDDVVNTFDVHRHLNLSKVYATVPANGEVTVDVVITGVKLDETLYPVGGYVETYISGEAKGTEEGVLYPTLNLPVLAYYGNWTSPSMYEIGTSTEWWDAYEGWSPYSGPAYVGGRLPYTAAFIYGGTGNDGLTNIIVEDGQYFHTDGESIGSDVGSLVYRYTPIRNSGNGVAQVTYKGADGKDHVAWRSDPMGPEYGVVYYSEQWLRPNLEGALYYSLFNTVEIDWASAVENIPDDAEEVTISVIKAPEYYAKYDYDWDVLTDGDTSNGELGEGAILSTTLDYDGDPPVIVSTDPKPDDEPPTISVTVKDNVSVIDITLLDSEGDLVQEFNPGIFDDTFEPTLTPTDADVEITVEFDGYHEYDKSFYELYGIYLDAGVNHELQPDLYTLTVTDSAGNETTKEILFGMEPTNVAETLEVNAEEIEILVGTTAQLEATVGPINLTDKGVKWASANEDIATVDENGLVTAVARGETTITVTTNANGSDGKPLTKEVEVTVITIPVTATGALGDANGHAKMFTWDFETGKLDYNAESVVDETVYPYALTRYENGTILVVDGEGTMYNLPADGALTPLGTSAEGAYTAIPYDMTYSAETGFWWTYNGYLLNETDPLDPQMYGFNFGNSNGTIFAIANTDEHWQYLYQDQELSGDSVIYRLTNQGVLQVTLLYNGGENALTLSLRLGIDAAFEGSQGQPYSNMAVGEDGALYISIMRNNTNEVYQLAFIDVDGSYMSVQDLLDANNISYTFIPLGDFGEDVWPGLLLDVKSNPAGASLDDIDAAYGTAVKGEATVIDVSTMEMQTFTASEIAASSDDSAEAAGTTTATGSLNSIEVSENTQVDDSGIVIDEKNHTVTVPVDAIDTTNGRFALEYDPDVLTLIELTKGTSVLTSVVTDETVGKIDVGFAAKNAVTALTVKAVFKYDPSVEDVTTTITTTVDEDGKDDDLGEQIDYPITLPGAKTAYDVTVSLGHGSSDAPATAEEGEDLTFTLTPDTGYTLPPTITVTVGGRVLDPSEYTYDPVTGTVTIPGDKVTGPVSVYANFPAVSGGGVVGPVRPTVPQPSNEPQQTPAKPSPEDTPKTGDAMPVALLATMMALSAASAAALLLKRKRNG